MTDDERLAELFRTAASDAAAPPPRFDHADVVAASRRITARRRTALVGGLGVLAAVGVVGALSLPGGPADREQATSAAAPMVAPEDGRRSGAAQEAPGGQESDSAAGAAPGAPQYSVPLGPAGAECADLQDPALRALVDEVLPEVAAAPPAATPDICIAGGVRRVSVQVGEGDGEGVLLVVYSPPSVPADAVSGALVATTASGGTVLVASSSTDPSAPVPLEDRLPALLEHLVPRL